MARAVPEWIGKTDDAPVPPRVRVRVFERHNGICGLSGRPIRAGEQWDLDHVVSLVNGGLHRESNLVPVLRGPHSAKTRGDLALKAINYRKRKAHLGIRKPSKFSCSRNSKFKKKVDGSVVLR